MRILGLPAVLIMVLQGFVPVIVAEETEQHWSFQKPVSPVVPLKEHLRHAQRVHNPIDAFILARLESHQLEPAPIADRQTLVRRAFFDLLGLPPSPEQLTAFLNDDSEHAWSELIDQLLKSKQYGERWGRHWLDVARYADSGGYETDMYYRNAWRYRDYVVKSFNDDKPYDRFVQEQIAGDELWPDNLDLDPRRVYHVTEKKRQHLEARIGTGFYTLGPEIHESALDAHRLRYETLTDWVDTTASAFMGLTLACARCHDHKFDPISQNDYFGMQAIFAGSSPVNEPLLTAFEFANWRRNYPRVLAVVESRRKYQLFEAQFKETELTKQQQEQKSKLLEEIANAVLLLPELAASVPDRSYTALTGIPTALVLGHEKTELVKPVYQLQRGELERPGNQIDPAFPAVLAEATQWHKPLPKQVGSRKQLALWLTQTDHPLTARVMVNRIWQWHFGRAIVATPNDFGKNGLPPTHPDLLDWLAMKFIDSGWSIKAMHRIIMQSSTYRMSSRFGPNEHLARDPNNRFVWRMNRRRLEAEALWDSVHATSGTLNLKMGGHPVAPPLAEDEIAALRDRWHWPVSADPKDHTRRGIYILIRRNFRFPMFEVFDAPVTSLSCPQRDVTTVALQALWNMNSPSVLQQAKHLAARVLRESDGNPDNWLEHLWLITLSRRLEKDEKQEAIAWFESLTDPAETADQQQASRAFLNDAPETLRQLPEHHALALIKICLAVYNLNEFAFVD